MLTVQWDVSVPQPLPHGEPIGTDRDVAAAQVVAIQRLASVGHMVKMLAVSKVAR
ncbi:hypothetical protein [Anabaenopsis elenkinii]|jgi:hypothetical protein|uniref:hypothetical protein n=1 Tax=Anabaenopsis elenkinii TaxID=156213 RepID=UPI001CEDA62A|nr:hypothetical protein [Anabaenopsis elenkinii]